MIFINNGFLYLIIFLDSDFGCRGAICLEKATIKEHEIDECRFDISVENVVWYLRADNLDDKRNWVEVLKSYRVSSSQTEQTINPINNSCKLITDIRRRINTITETWK